ncbi:MAG: ATP-binding protein [Bacteroidales bacterium]|nr:ATP-binding protein [Bacteroidales bacterium]
MSHHIIQLISQGEHQQLDFKYEVSDSQKLARTLVAFSNTDGGILLIGVRDNGSIRGIHSDEELYMVESAAHLFSKPQINYETKIWNLEGKTVIEIIVPKGDKRPYYARNDEGKWKVYIRVKDENFLANHILLEVWKREGRKKGTYLKLTSIEQKLLTYLEDNPKITIKEFCKLCSIPRRKAEYVLINLISINAVSIEFTSTDIYYSLNSETKERG